MVLGLLTALMAFTHWYPFVLMIWALRGGVDVLFLISTYSMAQLIVPNALLGRVITFIRVLTWPTGALGALLGGLAIAQTRNVGLVYGCVGLLVFLVAFAFWFTPPTGYVYDFPTSSEGRLPNIVGRWPLSRSGFSTSP